MRQITRWTLALLALIATGATASAQNYDGQGRLRFGVFMQGYAMGADETKPAVTSGDLNGYGVGASFGYDWSLGNGWIIGAEADAVVTDADKVIGTGHYYTDYLATFRGRLGYNVHPHLLLYGTGGWAINGLHHKSTTLALSNFKESGAISGFAAGGGLEYRFYDTIVFGEYLYTGFSKWDFADGAGVNHSLDTDAHQFRVGVKWIYGHDHYIDDVKYPRR